MVNVKKTSLYHQHESQAGKIIEFAGYLLPEQYSGIIKEHEAVRNAAGIFDVSHMGEVIVKGNAATEYVQKLITNDVEAIENNEIVYSLMCYEHGGIVDDLLAYKVNPQEYFLVINASNLDKDFQWILDNGKDYDVEITNVSTFISEMALQGPLAQEILQKLVKCDLSELKFFNFYEKILVSGKECLVSRTGYTGEDGFEIYCKNEDAEFIWKEILEEGKDSGLLPAGLGARDTLRFEAALPLYGNEINKNITPLEAGLGFAVKLNKESFIGKDALCKQKAEGLKRKTVGFEMVDRGIPRHGYEVKADGKVIGYVTTGYASPTLRKNIGLAIIESEYSALNTEIKIVVRKKELSAKVTSKKFLQKKYKK